VRFRRQAKKSHGIKKYNNRDLRGYYTIFEVIRVKNDSHTEKSNERHSGLVPESILLFLDSGTSPE
jgi:hypothetical protein